MCIRDRGWEYRGVTDGKLLWNQADNRATPTAAQAEVTRGVSHTIETLACLGTQGNSDATFKAWLNGVLVLDFRGIKMLTGDKKPFFRGPHYAPVWGGIGDSVAEDMTLSVGASYVSYGSVD